MRVAVPALLVVAFLAVVLPGFVTRPPPSADPDVRPTGAATTRVHVGSGSGAEAARAVGEVFALAMLQGDVQRMRELATDRLRSRLHVVQPARGRSGEPGTRLRVDAVQTVDLLDAAAVLKVVVLRQPEVRRASYEVVTVSLRRAGDDWLVDDVAV